MRSGAEFRERANPGPIFTANSREDSLSTMIYYCKRVNSSLVLVLVPRSVSVGRRFFHSDMFDARVLVGTSLIESCEKIFHLAFELICSRCGHTIYSGFDLRAPADVLKQFGDRCQSCNTKLVTDGFKVEVQKFDGAFTRPSQTATIAIPTRVRHLAPLPLTDSQTAV